ncbi:MAG TPA: ABC transporter ATP-binding protein/permease [Ferrovibrio sp.]|uniref:ABC transporter ATP-binding protein/permease n=1 Tax=Ferrovibrio sp. TaxID=1917215 RepID=UPI002ED022B2
MSRLAAFFRAFWGLAKPYWTRSDEKGRAWGLLIVIVALNLSTVALSVWFNFWYKSFYDSLQNRNFADFKTYLLQFCGVAVAFIIVAVYQTYLSQMLRLYWRRWLTDHWLDEWLARKRYYLMQLLPLGTDNPDQRLADDLRLFTDYSLSLALGLLNSVVTLFSFLGILWSLSGDFALPLFGHQIAIPGYMVWAALIYAGIGTWLTHKIGRPLVRLNFDQQRYEADFRFHLVRLRENVEGIALQDGEAAEKAALGSRFRHVVDNFFAIMKKQKQLTWFTSGYGQVATVFPFIVGAPRYFSGGIALGDLMQTVSAFGQVQSSLSYIIGAYTDIAEWWSVINRLQGFVEGLGKADAINAASKIAAASGETLAVENLSLELPDGRRLFDLDRLDLQAGGSLLIEGRSGNGKTTFFRALAGLWPFGKGRIQRPGAHEVLFLPQKPYLPIASLRAALAYPEGPDRYQTEEYRAALTAIGLGAFAGRLDEEANWAQLLSGGEQQRVQIARALLKQPRWLFLDEATSALDEASEAAVLEALRQALPHGTLVSIGHRPALAALHRDRLTLGAALPEPVAAE